MSFYVCYCRYFGVKKRDRGTIVFTTALLSVPSLCVSSTAIDNRKVMFSFNVPQPSLTHPTQLRLLCCTVLYCTVLGHVHVTFVIHAALPPLPEPVYLYVFAHTSCTSSCLLASRIGNDIIVCLATLHHARHAHSRHARQTSCTRFDQHRRDNSVIQARERTHGGQRTE